jgi:hypothetical protein
VKGGIEESWSVKAEITLGMTIVQRHMSVIKSIANLTRQIQ